MDSLITHFLGLVTPALDSGALEIAEAARALAISHPDLVAQRLGEVFEKFASRILDRAPDCFSTLAAIRLFRMMIEN
jgi:hypothetical protein